MPNFQYTARERTGSQRLGVIEARDVAEARQLLRAKELFVSGIQQKAATSSGRGLFRSRKVKLGDMVVMSRQLATLVRAGLSIIECLDVVAAQTESPPLAQAVQEVRLAILAGSTLADAMRKHPAIFTEKYVALVQAGEVGGVLDQTLEVAAEQFDQEANLRESVRSAFVYPMVVFVASVLVVAFMLIFIVPVFAKVYVQFNAELPAVTRMLVALSFLVVHYWWIALVSAVVVVKGLQLYIRTPRGRRLFDGFLLKMPLLGKLNRKIAVSRFTESLAGAVKAGVPILRGLAISAQTAGNLVIIEAVTKATALVKEGSSLSGPLEQTGQFPPMVTRMIAAGEQSGNLDEMLTQVTKFFRRDIEYTVVKLTRVMEPLMTVIVGGIVMFVLLALYMPVFNLSKVIQRS